MNKTLIPWVKNPDGTQGYTWNPITGCLNQIDGMCQGGNFPCYAYRLANTRLKERYLSGGGISFAVKHSAAYFKATRDPYYPRFWEDRLLKPAKGFGAYLRTKRKGIFVCDMSDLFGIGIPEEWTRKVLAQCKVYSKHRFYLLTKQPQNLIKFSPFPDNCWVGVTATDSTQYATAAYWLKEIEAKIKYVSIEPLLERIQPKAWPWQLFPEGKPEGICEWVIIGACTGTRKDLEALIERHPGLTLMPFGKKWSAQPEIGWVQGIALNCTKANTPLFLKDNLKPLLPNRMPFWGTYIWKEESNGAMITMSENRFRQEVPE